MDPSLHAEVLEVEPEAVHGGSVFTRTVHLAADSDRFACFEDRNHVSEPDVGQSVQVVLLGRAHGSVQGSNAADRGIRQSRVGSEDTSKWHVQVTGEVVHTEYRDEDGRTDTDLVALDIGPGTLLIEPNDELKEAIDDGSVTVGSVVNIECSRLDIAGRLDSD